MQKTAERRNQALSFALTHAAHQPRPPDAEKVVQNAEVFLSFLVAEER